MSDNASSGDGYEHEMVLEALPESVVASIEVRDRARRQLASAGAGLEFIVSDILAWPPGATVRVAFLDGDAELHDAVAGVTEQITDSCNIVLDFGFDSSTGEYRRWSEDDTVRQAEIRVSFDLDGYFSLVGTDSTDPTIGAPDDTVGGRPGQRSLNLGGFASSLPQRWEGTVRHEFLHALSFHHAHQNMRGPCEDQFRWDDDPGYVPTTNDRGVFIPDSSGRRPGIYTYLAGPPNGWSKATVDHNLRTEDDPLAVAGPFDSESVMLYRFAEFFYKAAPSPCAPTGDGLNLSEGDRRGLRLLYPSVESEVSAITTRSAQALDVLLPARADESSVGGRSPYEQRVIDLLSGRAARHAEILAGQQAPSGS